MLLPETSVESVFVGCYTRGDGGEGVGVRLVRRQPATGALGPVLSEVATAAPSYVAPHPWLPVLYAVNELEKGSVSAFGIEPDGSLTTVGGCPTDGAYPCHLDVHPDGRQVLVANYGSGSVTVVHLDERGVPVGRDVVRHSGRGPHPQRQQTPHAHMVISLDGVVWAVDLGTDTIVRHDLDPSTGELAAGAPEVRLPAGTGPRHVALDPAGRLHVVGELVGSLITLAATDAGWVELSTVSCSTAAGAAPSGIAVDTGGQFLYVANRGPDTVAAFRLTLAGPALVAEVPSGGSWPRDLTVVGRYLYVANERSHSVVTFVLDPVTGQPRPTGDILATPSPTCAVPYRPARVGQK